MKKITICFISHEDSVVLQKTLYHNLNFLLRDNIEKQYNIEIIILSSDSSTMNNKKIIEFSNMFNIDEIRIRNNNLKYSGDPSNDSHMHLLQLNTDYLITIESDVLIVPYKDINFSLKDIISDIDQYSLGLGYKISDYNCWVWELEKESESISKGVYSVNRVSSHFLIYNIPVFKNKISTDSLFKDDYTNLYNYEDKISKLFTEQNNKIAFFEKWPIEVWHCDKKTEEGSLYYTKDNNLKLEIIESKLYEN